MLNSQNNSSSAKMKLMEVGAHFLSSLNQYQKGTISFTQISNAFTEVIQKATKLTDNEKIDIIDDLMNYFLKFLQNIIEYYANLGTSQLLAFNDMCNKINQAVDLLQIKNDFVKCLSTEIFEMILDPDLQNWVSKEILRMYCVIIQNSDRTLRSALVKEKLFYYMGRLMDRIFYGDYEYQTIIVETFYRMCSKEVLLSMADKLYLNKDDAKAAFLNIDTNKFDEDTRNFLNILNDTEKNVISLLCYKVSFDDIQLKEPKDVSMFNGLWIDFNVKVGSITFFIDNTTFMPCNADTNWELIRIWSENISNSEISYTYNEEKVKKIAIGEFTLKGPCIMSQTNNHVLYSCRKLVLYSYNIERFKEIINQAFPKMRRKIKQKPIMAPFTKRVYKPLDIISIKSSTTNPSTIKSRSLNLSRDGHVRRIGSVERKSKSICIADSTIDTSKSKSVSSIITLNQSHLLDFEATNLYRAETMYEKGSEDEISQSTDELPKRKEKNRKSRSNEKEILTYVDDLKSKQQKDPHLKHEKGKRDAYSDSNKSLRDDNVMHSIASPKSKTLSSISLDLGSKSNLSELENLVDFEDYQIDNLQVSIKENESENENISKKSESNFSKSSSYEKKWATKLMNVASQKTLATSPTKHFAVCGEKYIKVNEQKNGRGTKSKVQKSDTQNEKSQQPTSYSDNSQRIDLRESTVSKHSLMERYLEPSSSTHNSQLLKIEADSTTLVTSMPVLDPQRLLEAASILPQLSQTSSKCKKRKTADKTQISGKLKSTEQTDQNTNEIKAFNTSQKFKTGNENQKLKKGLSEINEQSIFKFERASQKGLKFKAKDIGHQPERSERNKENQQPPSVPSSKNSLTPELFNIPPQTMDHCENERVELNKTKEHEIFFKKAPRLAKNSLNETAFLKSLREMEEPLLVDPVRECQPDLFDDLLRTTIRTQFDERPKLDVIPELQFIEVPPEEPISDDIEDVFETPMTYIDLPSKIQLSEAKQTLVSGDAKRKVEESAECNTRKNSPPKVQKPNLNRCSQKSNSDLKLKNKKAIKILTNIIIQSQSNENELKNINERNDARDSVNTGKIKDHLEQHNVHEKSENEVCNFPNRVRSLQLDGFVKNIGIEKKINLKEAFISEKTSDHSIKDLDIPKALPILDKLEKTKDSKVKEATYKKGNKSKSKLKKIKSKLEEETIVPLHLENRSTLEAVDQKNSKDSFNMFSSMSSQVKTKNIIDISHKDYYDNEDNLPLALLKKKLLQVKHLKNIEPAENHVPLKKRKLNKCNEAISITKFLSQKTPNIHTKEIHSDTADNIPLSQYKNRLNKKLSRKSQGGNTEKKIICESADTLQIRKETIKKEILRQKTKFTNEEHRVTEQREADLPQKLLQSGTEESNTVEKGQQKKMTVSNIPIKNLKNDPTIINSTIKESGAKVYLNKLAKDTEENLTFNTSSYSFLSSVGVLRRGRKLYDPENPNETITILPENEWENIKKNEALNSEQKLNMVASKVNISMTKEFIEKPKFKNQIPRTSGIKMPIYKKAKTNTTLKKYEGNQRESTVNDKDSKAHHEDERKPSNYRTKEYKRNDERYIKVLKYMKSSKTHIKKESYKSHTTILSKDMSKYELSFSNQKKNVTKRSCSPIKENVIQIERSNKEDSIPSISMEDDGNNDETLTNFLRAFGNLSRKMAEGSLKEPTQRQEKILLSIADTLADL